MKELIFKTKSIVNEKKVKVFKYEFKNTGGFVIKREGFKTEQDMFDDISENTKDLKGCKVIIVKGD